MPVYELRAFEPHHYIMLAEDIDVGLNVPRLARAFANATCVGHSGFYDNALIACGGIMMPWPGYGVAWALLAPAARDHAVFVHRHFYKAIKFYLNDLKLRRLEANVCESTPKAIAWIERLGFIEESTMPGYGPQGETFRKFVILK